MKAIVGQPAKLNFRNSYEGGLQGPCSAEVIDVSVQPPELGTVKDGVFTAAIEGAGKISAQFIFDDGKMNNHEIRVFVAKPDVREVQVPVGPKLIGGLIYDPDDGM